MSHHIEGTAAKDDAFVRHKPHKTGVWVGYERSGRHVIDIVELPGPAGEKLETLRGCWEQAVPVRERWVQRVSCKREFVAWGRLPPALHADIAAQHFPHETQVHSLHKDEVRTRGFHNPSSTTDDPEYFNSQPSNHRQHYLNLASECRQVLFMGWEVQKRLLAVPFFTALVIGAIVAVAVGFKTKDIATGAQVGSSLCGVIGTIFGYVIWRCSQVLN